MQSSKKWEKTGNASFTLWNSNQPAGTMEIALGTSERKATANIGGQQFVIKKTGFWKSNIEITDATGQMIARVYSEKWYAHSYVLEYRNRKYKLVVRNNPLAEWAIQDNHEDLLAYGLGTEKSKPSVRITSAPSEPELLFHFILWYLFLPIATEQGADDFTLLLLVA